MQLRKLLGLVTVAALLAVLFGSAQQVARAHQTTSGRVNAFHCIFGDDGQATVEAGSTVVIFVGWGTLFLGDQKTFLDAQTTIVSVNDAPMIDVSDQWSAPTQQDNGAPWASTIEYSTDVTLAQPGDQMQFTFALVLSREVREQFNAGAPPLVHGEGLLFGGTCTVTAV
jgi:hypothetical protein